MALESPLPAEQLLWTFPGQCPLEDQAAAAAAAAVTVATEQQQVLPVQAAQPSASADKREYSGECLCKGHIQDGLRP